MKPIPMLESELVEVVADDELLIHAWRAEQLRRIGLSDALADTFADRVDWREIESLVARGCPPELALEIAG
jgi:hypothetical protein